MSPTAVAEPAEPVARKLRELRAEQKRADREQKRIAERKLLEKARQDVDREAREAAKADRAKLAAEIGERLKGKVWCEIHVGGKTITVDLSSGLDSVSRMTAVEGCRRLALAASNAHYDRTIASRNAGKVLPADLTWFETFLASDAGGYHAHRLHLIGVRADL